MDDRAREWQDKVLEAMQRGGPSAVFELVSQMGVAVEQAPERDIGVRMRSGAATDQAFTTTHYLPAAQRPAGWPVDVPFVPDVAATLTRLDEPGRGIAVLWWKVQDPADVAELAVRESLANGWREQRGPQIAGLSALAGLRLIVLERGGVTRMLISAALQGVGLVSLIERGGSERHGDAVPPANPIDASA